MEPQRNNNVMLFRQHESWEEHMLQVRPVEQYRVSALRRHVCELIEAARRECNVDRRNRLLELAASFARTADAVEYEA